MPDDSAGRPRFLIDASLPRSVAHLVRAAGFEAHDVRDIGLKDAADERIAAHAQAEGLALVTADGDFGDIRRYPPASFRGIVVFDFQPADRRGDIDSVVMAVLAMRDVLSALPGRLVVVNQDRVRIRPRLVTDPPER